MYALFAFEDEGLPKIRKSLLFTSSLLIFLSFSGIKLDLDWGAFATSNGQPELFDPTWVLLPLSIYLLVRLWIVARWSLPLAAGVEFERDEKIIKLAGRLESFEEHFGKNDDAFADIPEAVNFNMDELSNLADDCLAITRKFHEELVEQKRQFSDLRALTKEEIKALESAHPYVGPDDRFESDQQRTKRVERGKDVDRDNMDIIDQARQIAKSYRDRLVDFRDTNTSLEKSRDAHQKVRSILYGSGLTAQIREVILCTASVEADLLKAIRRREFDRKLWGVNLPTAYAMGAVAIWIYQLFFG